MSDGKRRIVMKEITVEEITLPHHHGEKKRMGSLCRELKNIEHFTAVSEIFRQLSDPTRVRIFWLLSHQEECVINIAAMMEMSSPAVSHHLKSLTESGGMARRSIIRLRTRSRSVCFMRSLNRSWRSPVRRRRWTSRHLRRRSSETFIIIWWNIFPSGSPSRSWRGSFL